YFRTRHIDKIKRHLELQKKVETEETEYDNPYDLSVEDLHLAHSIIDQQLQNSGFKRIADDEFEKRINLIFNINSKSECIKISYGNDYITLFGNLMDGKLKTLLYNQYSLNFFTQNIFFSKEKHFLFEMFTLEEIITINNNDSYSLKVPEYIINRNKYLFNDNKGSLMWLKTHDKFFLESLVKTFGYVKDKDLLKWVLDKKLLKNSQDDVEEFAKILGTRNCDGKIEFHKEVFDFMLTQNEIEREKYAASLLHFRDYYKNTGKDLSFSELTKIRAIVCYYGTKMSDNYFYSFFPYLHSEKYAEEFKKNNYYNISDFKELYEDAKYGGINEPY
ncbi:hypothetical protein, partial [Flavobacterium hercynium]